jgi:hypothetical protein
MDATAPAFSPVILKAGDTARARSTNRRPEGEPATSSTVGERVETGSSRGGTGHSCSPRIRSGARLVTKTTRAGHDSISSATSDDAPSKCSRLSSTKSSRFSPR